MMSEQSERRDFMKAAGAAGVGFWVAGGVGRAESESPNEKVNIAIIGAGGKGKANINGVRNQNIVALCDVDENRAKEAFNQFPDVKKFKDFRKMLDEMDKQIDAVIVTTPDHQHAPASIRAMKMGKHVYCEKPLTHDVYEARRMTEVAREMKVATQMGNQGTSHDGLRQAVEVIQSGAIGPVTEAHVWTNRPIWPQGNEALLEHQGVRAALGMKANPPKSVPKHINWDLWLGSATDRPYDDIYAPFKWRGWWDFGTGALGDMACHTANMLYMALKLGAPTTISAKSSKINPLTATDWATVEYEFPAREEMPACKVTWYEGHISGVKNLPPAELFHGEKPTGSGSMLVGEKGILYSPNDYGAAYVLLPKNEFEGYKPPEPWIKRSPGHYKEWIEACKGGEPAMSNFDYAGPLSEFVLLGNVAIRAGKKLEWDAENLRCPNCSEAEQYLRREYRKGWEV